MIRFPHTPSDGAFAVLLVVILPLVGGLFWLYNAYRLGKLKWKPKGTANPRTVNFAILAGILLAVALLTMVC